MFDYNNLIGLTKDEAVEFLHKNNVFDIEFKLNAKHNDLCNTVLVCKAEEDDGHVVLTCGEFYFR